MFSVLLSKCKTFIWSRLKSKDSIQFRVELVIEHFRLTVYHLEIWWKNFLEHKTVRLRVMNNKGYVSVRILVQKSNFRTEFLNFTFWEFFHSFSLERILKLLNKIKSEIQFKRADEDLRIGCTVIVSECWKCKYSVANLFWG